MVLGINIQRILATSALNYAARRIYREIDWFFTNRDPVKYNVKYVCNCCGKGYSGAYAFVEEEKSCIYCFGTNLTEYEAEPLPTAEEDPLSIKGVRDDDI